MSMNNKVLLKKGTKVICHCHSNNVYIVQKVTNFHFYKIPNVLVLDRNQNLVCVTEFTPISQKEYMQWAKFEVNIEKIKNLKKT